MHTPEKRVGNPMRNLLVALSFLLLAGCIPDAENPLTAPDKASLDHSLLGTWGWQEDDESGFIHIGLDERSRRLRVVMVDFDKEREIEISAFIGHTSSLDGKKYLNLKWDHPAQADIAGYIIVKYRVNSTSLGIALMDGNVVETAIESGSLDGSLEKGKASYQLHITAGQNRLRAFVVENDKALFPEMKYVRTLKPVR